MSIDSCYEGVVAKLTSKQKIVSISNQLLSLNSNDKRVLYVYELIEELNAFPIIKEVVKSDNLSTHYRNQGNQCFQNGNDFKALQFYNLSLLHANVLSENYFTALSNRSAVLYSMEKFQECLKDIDDILSSEHPEKLDAKLIKRQSLCKNKMSKQKASENLKYLSEICELLTVKGSKDDIYICASNKLKVAYSNEMGRHIIAKEDIRVGEVLVKENPYFTLLLKSQLLNSCSYCISRDLNLIPCDNCCFALFCSKECKEKAWKDYHEVECPLMATLIELQFTKIELLALRAVIKARTDHSDWDSLFQTIEKAEATDKEHKGCVEINNQLIYDSKYYASIHTLESNINKRSISDIFQKSVTSAVFLNMLIRKTKFLLSDDPILEKKILECVSGLLLLHSMTSPTNMHGLCTNIANADGNYVDDLQLASAPYAFLSLLNHSCAPNVVRYSRLGSATKSLIAIRPIKRGMQLLDNYGSHHALQDREERYSALKFQYKFNCICEACVNNWPTYLRLPPAFGLNNNVKQQHKKLLNSDNLYKLQKGDKDTALKLYRPLCVLIGILEGYAPCMELADCQEAMKQCLAIFSGVLPYEYSKNINW